MQASSQATATVVKFELLNWGMTELIVQFELLPDISEVFRLITLMLRSQNPQGLPTLFDSGLAIDIRGLFHIHVCKKYVPVIYLSDSEFSSASNSPILDEEKQGVSESKRDNTLMTLLSDSKCILSNLYFMRLCVTGCCLSSYQEASALSTYYQILHFNHPRISTINSSKTTPAQEGMNPIPVGATSATELTLQRMTPKR